MKCSIDVMNCESESGSVCDFFGTAGEWKNELLESPENSSATNQAFHP
jgi:hypothetical protein